MSYKKLVAGIATAAVASAMVVPAAFAAVTYDHNDANATSATSDKATAIEKKADFEAEKKAVKENTALTVAEVNAKVAALDKAIAALSNDVKKETLENEKNKAAEELEAAIADAKKAKSENKGTAALESAINKAQDVLDNKFEKSTKDLKDAKSDLDKAVKAVKDVNKDNKDAKQKLIDDVLRKADKALDQLAWFNDRSDKVTVGDKVYTIDRLEAEILQYRTIVGDKNFVDNNTVTVKGYVAWLEKAIDALNAKLKSADPDALTPYGVKAKAACEKNVKVVKKGAALPKTSDVAPVAPIAAVAGSAALIAAGLVASRKVNA